MLDAGCWKNQISFVKVRSLYWCIPNRSHNKLKNKSPQFEAAIAAFDALNAQDPNAEIVNGQVLPRELVYAKRMTDRLLRFKPDASEALQLAARSQHIQRWTIPRSEFPMDRVGYKRWRNRLMQFHAETAGRVMQDVGYDDETISQVQDLLKKRGLQSNDDAQALEDVICLVFLENYAADFAAKHEEEKMIKILQKTWKKMSAKGHAAALALSLPAPVEALVEKALA